MNDAATTFRRVFFRVLSCFSGSFGRLPNLPLSSPSHSSWSSLLKQNGFKRPQLRMPTVDNLEMTTVLTLNLQVKKMFSTYTAQCAGVKVGLIFYDLGENLQCQGKICCGHPLSHLSVGARPGDAAATATRHIRIKASPATLHWRGFVDQR